MRPPIVIGVAGRRLAFFACLIAALFFAVACAGSAMDAVARAHAAIGSARSIGAQKHAGIEMTLAVAAFELAEDAIMEGTTSGYKRALKYAREAEKQAISAKEKAKAAKLKVKKITPSTSTPTPTPSPAVRTPHPPKRVSSIERRRYVAAARRRVRNAALAANRRGKLAIGKVEVECWISPDGRIIQILLTEGSPSHPLTQQILKGISAGKMDPFPPEMDDEYLKIRVKIDTTKRRVRHK